MMVTSGPSSQGSGRWAKRAAKPPATAAASVPPIARAAIRPFGRRCGRLVPCMLQCGRNSLGRANPWRPAQATSAPTATSSPRCRPGLSLPHGWATIRTSAQSARPSTGQFREDTICRRGAGRIRSVNSSPVAAAHDRRRPHRADSELSRLRIRAFAAKAAGRSSGAMPFRSWWSARSGRSWRSSVFFPPRLFPPLEEVAATFVRLTVDGILPHHVFDTLLRLGPASRSPRSPASRSASRWAARGWPRISSCRWSASARRSPASPMRRCSCCGSASATARDPAGRLRLGLSDHLQHLDRREVRQGDLGALGAGHGRRQPAAVLATSSCRAPCPIS